MIRQSSSPGPLKHYDADKGSIIGVCRIKRIRKKLVISCKQRKKFKGAADSRHLLLVTEIIVNQQFEASVPNPVWAEERNRNGISCCAVR